MKSLMSTHRHKIERSLKSSIFSSIYIFGSSLVKKMPGDIDIILVYENGTHIQDIEKEKSEIIRSLNLDISPVNLDFVTLSQPELEKTDFLSKVQYQQIK